MIRPKKLPRDSNERAHRIASLLVGDSEDEKGAERSVRSMHLSEIGRKGGLKGGKARAAKLSKKRKTAIARKGGLACWNSNK